MGKRLKPEEIIAKLREVEVRLARGETVIIPEIKGLENWTSPALIKHGGNHPRN